MRKKPENVIVDYEEIPLPKSISMRDIPCGYFMGIIESNENLFPDDEPRLLIRTYDKVVIADNPWYTWDSLDLVVYKYNPDITVTIKVDYK